MTERRSVFRRREGTRTMSNQSMMISRRRGLQLLGASVLPWSLTGCTSDLAMELVPRSVLEWTVAAVTDLPFRLASTDGPRIAGAFRPESFSWLFADYPTQPDIRSPKLVGLNHATAGFKQRPSDMDPLETRDFYDTVKSHGMNIAVAEELANIIGCDAVLECMQQRVPIWFQANQIGLAVNEVEIVARNNAGGHAQGYFHLQIEDSITGKIEHRFRSSSGYSLAPAGDPAVWRETVAFDFLKPGPKRILVEDFGNGVRVEPANVLVVPVSVS